MNLSRIFNKPEYYYKPSALFRKIIKPSGRNRIFSTPWGTRIEADWTDAIGRTIGLFGVYDLALTELLWRLVEPGNFVLDIGTNIGYMSGICSDRVGPKGKVWAFEPNPLLLPRLRQNIERMPLKNVKLHEFGLSDHETTADLIIPHDFNGNAGIAYVGDKKDGQSYTIALKRLDDVIASDESIAVAKLDVEGHELQVLKGASRLLSQKKIRHILFEELQSYPSPVAGYLTDHGYTIYRIEKMFRRISLAEPNSPKSPKVSTTNYLATLDTTEVMKKTAGQGYKCLRGSH